MIGSNRNFSCKYDRRRRIDASVKQGHSVMHPYPKAIDPSTASYPFGLPTTKNGSQRDANQWQPPTKFHRCDWEGIHNNDVKVCKIAHTRVLKWTCRIFGTFLSSTNRNSIMGKDKEDVIRYALLDYNPKRRLTKPLAAIIRQHDREWTSELASRRAVAVGGLERWLRRDYWSWEVVLWLLCSNIANAYLSSEDSTEYCNSGRQIVDILEYYPTKEPFRYSNRSHVPCGVMLQPPSSAGGRGRGRRWQTSKELSIDVWGIY